MIILSDVPVMGKILGQTGLFNLVRVVLEKDDSELKPVEKAMGMHATTFHKYIHSDSILQFKVIKEKEVAESHDHLHSKGTWFFKKKNWKSLQPTECRYNRKLTSNKVNFDYTEKEIQRY